MRRRHIPTPVPRRAARSTRRPAGRVAILLAALACAAAGGPTGESLPRPIEKDVSRAAVIAAGKGGEVFRLHWELSGLIGAVVGVFVPSSGDALLTFVPASDERQEVQLLVTAPGREEEYFLYGAEIDGRTGWTTRVWSSYVFRDRDEDREERLTAHDVIDFASAIHHLRRHPPAGPQRLEVWNGGTTYPAEVRPLKPDTRRIGGVKTRVRGYEVRGIKIPGKPRFKDTFRVYFTTDTRATPVEIVGKRGWVTVRFELEGPPP